MHQGSANCPHLPGLCHLNLLCLTLHVQHGLHVMDRLLCYVIVLQSCYGAGHLSRNAAATRPVSGHLNCFCSIAALRVGHQNSFSATAETAVGLWNCYMAIGGVAVEPMDFLNSWTGGLCLFGEWF